MTSAYLVDLIKNKLKKGDYKEKESFDKKCSDCSKNIYMVLFKNISDSNNIICS